MKFSNNFSHDVYNEETYATTRSRRNPGPEGLMPDDYDSDVSDDEETLAKFIVDEDDDDSEDDSDDDDETEDNRGSGLVDYC